MFNEARRPKFTTKKKLLWQKLNCRHWIIKSFTKSACVKRKYSIWIQFSVEERQDLYIVPCSCQWNWRWHSPYLCLNYSHFQDLCHCHYQFLQSYSISWVKFESSSSQVRVQFKFESRVKFEWILIVSFICLYLFIYFTLFSVLCQNDVSGIQEHLVWS